MLMPLVTKTRAVLLFLTWMILLFGPRVVGAEEDPRLISAIKGRNVEAVMALLEQGAAVNERQADGATALHWAVHWDDVASAKALIQAGAHVNVENELGVTPLFIATADASAVMVETLLAAGADARTALPSGETALMAAARTGKHDAVRALVSRGADPNAREHLRGQTALMWAAAEEHVEMVRVLLDLGARIDGASMAGHTALLSAARTGNIPVVELLLDRGANIETTAADGSTPLLIATVRGQVPLARFLLDRGADPNVIAAGYTPLHWASAKWQTTMTPFYQHTPLAGELFWVPASGRINLIKALLASGADPNARVVKDAAPRYGTGITIRTYVPGSTPFLLAALTGETDIMRLLLANGADPTAVSGNHTTALIAAAGIMKMDGEAVETEEDHLEGVKLAYATGADVDAANDEGETALHGVAYSGYDSIAHFLLDRGADVNARNNKGTTPLRAAEGSEYIFMLYRNLSTAKILREAGGISEPRGVVPLR